MKYRIFFLIWLLPLILLDGQPLLAAKVHDEAFGIDGKTDADITVGFVQRGVLAAPDPNPVDIEWIDGEIFLTDPANGLLYRIDPLTGTYDSLWLGYGIHGVCYDRSQYLYVSNQDSHTILKILPQAGSIVNRFDAPGALPGGMAYGDGVIWLSESGENRIYQLDPIDGAILAVQSMPQGTNLHGLAYYGGLLFAVDVQGGRMVAVDPETMQVMAEATAPGEDCHGMGVFGLDSGARYLLVTDKSAAEIHLVQIFVAHSIQHMPAFPSTRFAEPFPVARFF